MIDEVIAGRRAPGRPRLRWRGGRPPGRLRSAQAGHRPGRLRPAVSREQRFRPWRHQSVEGKIKPGSFFPDAQGRWCRNGARAIEGKTLGGVAELDLKAVATCSESTVLEQASCRDLDPKPAEGRRRDPRRDR
jgi:hypothetical protein